MKQKNSRNRLLCLLGLAFFFTASPLEKAWGINYFAKPELGGTCTQVNPCYFVNAVNTAGNGDTVYFKEGVYYDGNFPDHVLLVSKSVNLLGGWNGDPSGPLIRRPDTYRSTLDGKDNRRVIYINGLITPTIDGFTIINGNATGWATNCSGNNAKGCGGGIFVYRAGARIINNKILNNRAHTVIGESGYGGGIHLEEASGAVIRDNLIQGNQASPTGSGEGGGLAIYGAAQDLIRINDNHFINNHAAYGGAIIKKSVQAHSIIHNNTFENNSAQRASGLAVWGENTITKNRFQYHQGQETIFLTTLQGTFEDNTIVSNNTTAGLWIAYRKSSIPTFFQQHHCPKRNQCDLCRGNAAIPLFAELEHNTLVGGRLRGGRFRSPVRTTM